MTLCILQYNHNGLRCIWVRINRAANAHQVTLLFLPVSLDADLVFLKVMIYVSVFVLWCVRQKRCRHIVLCCMLTGVRLWIYFSNIDNHLPFSGYWLLKIYLKWCKFPYECFFKQTDINPSHNDCKYLIITSCLAKSPKESMYLSG